MRVIAGVAKGRRLASPGHLDVRPMMDKVRMAVFNMLEALHVLQGARVLDLYAGTGSVGIEALSRGAEHADFVEWDPRVVRLIRENLRRTGFEDQAHVFRMRVEHVLERPHVLGEPLPYQIVSATPPYEAVDYNVLVPRLLRSPLVGADSVVIVEYPRELAGLPKMVAHFHKVRDRRYGRTRVALYCHEAQLSRTTSPEER
ncbi:MAG: 16S rRNA (guanine(966)-N(2))-methyltransferase RsmD [Ardenticatenia bacterium]|nr:16S rRNA (guanine(966)-N(2))-methyltransferase RsmD [Ardenticatenia bacterium]